MDPERSQEPRRRRRRRRVFILRLVLMAAVIAVGIVLATMIMSNPGALIGDDNSDGLILEDESGWDCRTMGNRICGPGNAQGVAPGYYGSKKHAPP